MWKYLLLWGSLHLLIRLIAGNNLSYTDCISLCKSTLRGKTDPNTIEHVGFLIHLLNKFMFCANAQRVSKEYINLALHLAVGNQKVVVTPYMVGLLYRSLGHLVDKGIYDTIGGLY